MKSRKWTVSFLNDWNNPVELFSGTEVECNQWYENNISKCESKDAFCSPASDPDNVYYFNHPFESALDFDMWAFE